MRHILKKHEIAGLGVLESLYPPNLKQPRHNHKLASFSFVLEGSYIENLGRRAQTRRSAAMVFHPPQESHSVHFQDEAVRILSVQFDSRRLAYVREHSIVLDRSTSRRSEEIAWLGRRLHYEFRRGDNFSALAIEGLVLEMLAEASRLKSVGERNEPDWLFKAKEYLHDNLSESIACDDVARIAGVHPVHLARVFREKTGCTMGEYLRRVRIEFASRQISGTNVSLSEIALAAGFADQSHLTKTFKAHFGVTPSNYRRLCHRC